MSKLPATQMVQPTKLVITRSSEWEYRNRPYNHITFTVAPMQSAPSTFVVQTSDSLDQSVLTTDFADSSRKLRETVAKV